MDMDAFRSAPEFADLAFLAPTLSESPRYVFQRGNTYFLLPLGQRAEILLRPTLYFFPLAPQSLLGIVNIRGQAVPVFDPFAANESSGDTIKQILFFPEESDGFALSCDKVNLVSFSAQNQSLDPKHFAPPALRSFISNAFFFEEKIYLLCDWPSWIESLYVQ